MKDTFKKNRTIRTNAAFVKGNLAVYITSLNV
jgi:hypothetical protein